MKRKLLSLLLCGAMLAGTVTLLASCADKEPAKTTAGNLGDINPEDRFIEKLKGVNFANEGLAEEDLTVSVAYVEGSNGAFTQRSLQADELSDNAVDIETLKRDQRMKEQLGLELYIELVGNGGIMDMEGAVGTALTAGDSDFDILAGYQYFGIGMAAKGWLLDLADMTDFDADYIDLEAKYWGKSFNDNMSYKGAYYWITGDLALRYVGGMYCTFVNSAIYTTKLSSEESIYNIVKKGEWTIDKMTEMARQCYEDNGTTAGEPDEEDTFGFGYEPTDMIDGIAIGCGVQFTYKDPATGDVSITINNKRAYTISNKISTLANDKSFAYKYPDGDSANVMQAFANGTVAFTVNKLFQAEVYLEEFEDFYIVPAPKLDTDQTNYVTGVHDGCTIFGITHCSTKVRQAAAALEFLCAYSSKDVLPTYYDGAMKNQYTRDPEAAAMIDLIHDNVTTDFAVAWGNSINGISQIFRDCTPFTGATIARDKTRWEGSLKTLTESLEQYATGGEEA